MLRLSIGRTKSAYLTAACRIPGSVADSLASADGKGVLVVEHPSGGFEVDIALDEHNDQFVVTRSALLRTARKLMDGRVFVPEERL